MYYLKLPAAKHSPFDCIWVSFMIHYFPVGVSLNTPNVAYFSIKNFTLIKRIYDIKNSALIKRL